MSTPAAVAVHTEDGYVTIYVHNDGYFDYMYPLLSTYYDTDERAQNLVKFGDASFLAKRLAPSTGSGHSFMTPEEDVCIFYHRDRCESWVQNAPHVFMRDQLLGWQYYVYIFEDGQWKAYRNGKEVDSYEY